MPSGCISRAVDAASRRKCISAALGLHDEAELGRECAPLPPTESPVKLAAGLNPFELPAAAGDCSALHSGRAELRHVLALPECESRDDEPRAAAGSTAPTPLPLRARTAPCADAPLDGALDGFVANHFFVPVRDTNGTAATAEPAGGLKCDGLPPPSNLDVASKVLPPPSPPQAPSLAGLLDQ
eukprot:scaffold189661_cov33-Tisochrysis_lutea.AAC.2